MSAPVSPWAKSQVTWASTKRKNTIPTTPDPLGTKRKAEEERKRRLDIVDLKEAERTQDLRDRRHETLRNLRQKSAARRQLEEQIGTPYRTNQIVDGQRTMFSKGRRLQRLRTPPHNEFPSFEVPATAPQLLAAGHTAPGDVTAGSFASQARTMLMTSGGLAGPRPGNTTPPRMTTAQVEVKDWRYYSVTGVPAWDRKEYLPRMTRRMLSQAEGKGEAFAQRAIRTADAEAATIADEHRRWQRDRRNDIRAHLARRRLDRIELAATATQPVSGHDLKAIESIITSFSPGQGEAPPPDAMAVSLPAIRTGRKPWDSGARTGGSARKVVAALHSETGNKLKKEDEFATQNAFLTTTMLPRTPVYPPSSITTTVDAMSLDAGVTLDAISRFEWALGGKG
ncbi:hypothetical protein J8273_1727 [Carpediemonas membranifera]|uniref:Uncharacterized protein n=1 Tax=Carpediemonas membranifera TaxID=201153 RepID=A0A8J6B8Z8_9EUKA|nr:hypothetical protein J8273_1727 [Carpediemonas membranifera]|eukprot:KAG9396709.1 hypothetical protein J8273_1727 [Carpediemonas membranifera]